MSSNGASAAPAGTMAQVIRWRGGAFSNISGAPKYGKYGLHAGKGYAPIWFSEGRGMYVIALWVQMADSGVVRCVRRSLSCAYLHRTTDCYERVSVRGKVLTRRGEGGCSLCDLSCCVGSKTRKNRRPAHSFLTLRSPSGRLHIQLRRQRRLTTQPR